MPLQIPSWDHDDDLLVAASKEPGVHIRVCTPHGLCLVLGRGSDPEKELEIAACLRDGVPIRRRKGGGCAVLLDPGNVLVSVLLPVEGLGGNLKAFETLSSWLIECLDAAGVPGVRREGVSDLALGGRKVAGACIYRTKGLLYYAASLLVEPRVDLMQRYLKHPPREPRYRCGRSHAAFVRGLGGQENGLDAASLSDSIRSRIGLIAHGKE